MFDWLTSNEPHTELAQRHASGWLKAHLPEVDALYGVPQTAIHHPEVDTGRHIELCLEMSARLGADFETRFAVLSHDLGKGLTPPNEWPKHVNHEHGGLAPVNAVCGRFNLPAEVQKLALLVCEWHLHCHRAFEMGNASVVKFLDSTGMLANEVLFERFVLACECDARGRLGKQDDPYERGKFLRAVRQAIVPMEYPAGIDMHHPAGNRIHQQRVAAVARIRTQFCSD